MQPTVESSQAPLAQPITPTFIVSLIEGAVNTFEVDRAASRDYLLRAFSLIRAQDRESQASTVDPARGRLATWQANRVIAYIDANLSRPLQAKDLANLVNLSVSHFFRAFKVSVGVTPCEFITRRRVEFARILMATTEEPLSQVALGCGLNDQSSFCRVFRRVVGQSPSEWRRANAREPRTLRPRASGRSTPEIPSAGVVRAP
jgi:AraC-like DNA-binding protein